MSVGTVAPWPAEAELIVLALQAYIFYGVYSKMMRNSRRFSPRVAQRRGGRRRAHGDEGRPWRFGAVVAVLYVVSLRHVSTDRGGEVTRSSSGDCGGFRWLLCSTR